MDKKKKIGIIAAAAAVVLIVVIAIVIVLLGNSYDTDTSTVFILDKGKIVTTDVEKFDDSKYSSEELEAFVQKTIDTYNDENGKDSVKQKSLKFEEGVATLIMEYANAKVYKDMYGVELFTGTVAEALEAGYKFDLDYAKITDGKASACEAGDITGQKELKVAIIKANTKVVVDGKILYVSADNVAEFGKDYVVLKDNTNVLNIVDVDTEELTEGTLTTEDLVVDEGELVVGTEVSTEIIFDFGDEEVEKEEVKYTEKYVYIIYE